jgi:hypothetical protein
MTTKTQGMSAEDIANDVNVVALWTSVDKTRWVAGIVSGWIAAAIAMSVGGIISTSHGYEFLFPVKLLGAALLGPSATAYGSTSGLVAGLIVTGLILGVWGFVYGHFVRSNSLYAMLGMGFTWGTFLWIFDWNLLLKSVKAISAAEIPSGAAFAVCMAYGFGMSVISVVDPILRGNKR